MYPFLTLDDDTEIVHSDLLDGGRVKVYVERPDEQVGFRDATCYLPDYEWVENHGFSEDEIARYEGIIASCAHLIIEFAESGGFDRASGF